jgi:hypothetical protein
MYDLKLPTEWVQMFRILLSIYLAWLILLSPRKPIFNDNLLIRCVFVLLIILFGQSDIISALLLLLIYFFSFQVILPMENFESNDEEEMNNSNTSESPFLKTIDANLKRGYEEPTPSTRPAVKIALKNDYHKMLGLPTE